MKRVKPLHCKGICVATMVGALLISTGLHAEESLSASETLSERTKEILSDPSRTGSLVGSILAGAAVANPLAPLLGSVAGFMIGKSSAFTQKDDAENRRLAHNNRSLMPTDGTQITSLSGLSNEPSEGSGPALITGMFGDAAAQELSDQSGPLVITKLPGEADTESPQTQRDHAAIRQLTEDQGARDLPEQIQQAVIMGLPRQAGTNNVPVQTELAVTQGLTEEIQARINLQKQLAYACSNVEVTRPLSANCYYYSQ